MQKYQTPIARRTYTPTKTAKFRGGKLFPAGVVPFMQAESGTIACNIMLELDPIAGRVITPITAHVVSVFVPVQAMHVLNNPEMQYAGNDEVIRNALVTGEVLFPLEEENELSKRMGVIPRDVAGTKMVSSSLRLAHNAGMNYLRRRIYAEAAQLEATNLSVAPALLSSTALDWFNGVLDPEDKVAGQVNFDFEGVNIPITGLGLQADSDDLETVTYSQSDLNDQVVNGNKTAEVIRVGNGMTDTALILETTQMNGETVPIITAKLADAESTGISLRDFYTAETADALARVMRQIKDDNPEYGDQMVLNWAHGLNIEVGKQPFVIYEKEVVFGARERYATNGADLDTSQSDMMTNISFNTMVPKTEFGGVVVTFIAVKPDETIPNQPDPFLTEPWGAINFAADELKIDPQPVTVSDLLSDPPDGSEQTVVFYTGNNELKRAYMNYGLGGHSDGTELENKTLLWQYDIPASVDPNNIIYPDDIPHFPFADQLADVVTYTIATSAQISTPIIFGPTPIEELDIIDTEGLLPNRVDQAQAQDRES